MRKKSKFHLEKNLNKFRSNPFKKDVISEKLITHNKLNVSAIYNHSEDQKSFALDPQQRLSESLLKAQKYKDVLNANIVDYDKLKQLAWDGIPKGTPSKAFL